MTIEDEMSKLPTLQHVGLALVQFVYSLQGGSFQKRTEWIYRPNFIALAVRRSRTEKIVLSLQYYPREIEDREVLPLFAGFRSYVRGEITNARQLACAARYIEESWRAWHTKIYGS